MSTPYGVLFPPMAKKRKGVGRVTKLNPDTHAIICDAIKGGATNKDACAFANIHWDTFYKWLERGEKEPDSIYGAFARGVEDARPDFKKIHRDVIIRAALETTTTIKTTEKLMPDGETIVTETVTTESPPTWQPSAWLLERRFPEEYGRRTEISGELKGGPAPVINLVCAQDSKDDDGTAEDAGTEDA